MRSTHSRIALVASAGLAILASLCGTNRPARAEPTFELLKSFEATAHPSGPLVQGSDGALYGTTRDGGAANLGIVFRIDAGGNFTCLHSFSGTDGAYPWRLVGQGADGALYGTTSSGGSSGHGTVFKIDSAGTFTSLHSFDTGYEHQQLVLASDGALYGSIRPFGSYGIVFKIDAGGTFSTLHTFDGSDGYSPSGLIEASDGAFYGTTSALESTRLGTVFRIDSAGNFTSLYSFSNPGGYYPTGDLARGSDGAIYGIAVGSVGSRTFRVDSAGTFSFQQEFRGWVNSLFQASDGAIYGTTSGTTSVPGGYGGSIFQLDRYGLLTTLHTFPPDFGPAVRWNPMATFWGDGVLYGTVNGGGGTLVFTIDGAGSYTEVSQLPGGADRALTRDGAGALYGITSTSVFRIDRAGNLTSLHSFSSADGAGPSPSLALGSDGALYGTTTAGGSSDRGTIFRIDHIGSFTPLHSFDLWSPSEFFLGSDGAALYGLAAGSLFRIDAGGAVTSVPVQWPSGSVQGGGQRLGPSVAVTDGAFYWIESVFPDYFAGPPGWFGIFKVDRAGNGTVLHYVQGYDSDCSTTGLVVGSDGAFYGGTSIFTSYGNTCGGGPSAMGAIFRIEADGAFASLHSFSDTDGPSAPLVLGSDGALYGTTTAGVFRIDNAGLYTPLHSFSGPDGAHPSAALTPNSDGALYGITRDGGSSDLGTVFRIDRSGVFTSLHSFSGTDGTNPSVTLVPGRAGVLYGITAGGGSSGAGTVFQIDADGTFSSLHSFSGADGARPTALVLGNDCALVGTAEAGGPGGGGVLYRVFEAGHLCQHLRFDPLPDRTLGDPPFAVSAISSSGFAVSFTASGSCTVTGDQVTLTGVGLCTLTASQAGDASYEPAPDVSQSFHVLFDFTGFLRPLLNPPVVNRVKAGRTVPIRFSLGGDQGRDVLAEGSPSVRPVPCDPSAPVNDLEGLVAGRSSTLLHAPKRRGYTYLWRTEKSWAGTCQELSLELVDGSIHRASFRFEPARRLLGRHGEQR